MTQTADILLTNAIILTLDEKLSLYEPGALVVNGENITAVGSEAEIRAMFTAKEVIDCQGKVLMPAWSIPIPTLP
jgi:predicted amidohydrolase YtcJ